MKPKFGEVRRINYAAEPVTVMAIGLCNATYISEEGTGGEDEIIVLTLARPFFGKPKLDDFFPVNGTATCSETQWDLGEVLS